jgi:glutathione S-transferase
MYQLYDFPFSHYCEKVRWALDYKGVDYDSRQLLPGFHIRTVRKLAPLTCLPILAGEGSVVQDSTEIINFLERRFPDPPLTPKDPEQANQAIEWEEYLDEEVGVTVRLWFYFHTLPDRKRSIRFLCQGASSGQRLLFGFAFSPIRKAMTEMMDVRLEPSRNAERRLLKALDKLDRALAHRDFLVGDHFSRADLTACALLWPLYRPGESEADVRKLLPEAVCALHSQARNRRSFGWVCDMYRQRRARVPANDSPENTMNIKTRQTESGT